MRYLWVISDNGIPYILEATVPGRVGFPKHTNLTGGGPAHIGGELWFADPSNIFVSGGSGRFPPANHDQLQDAVAVFEAYDYGVKSLGWDKEYGPKRILETASD